MEKRMLTVTGVLRYDKVHFDGNCRGAQAAVA